MSRRPIAFNNSAKTNNSIKKNTIEIGIASDNYANNPGGLTWFNGADSTDQYVIYSDTFSLGMTTLVNAKPVCWSTGDLTDVNVLNTINRLPTRINQTAFTTIASALEFISASTIYNIVGGPLGNIVTNGLVLYLDASQKGSYPGSGTGWYTLSGNAYNGTLSNGASFNTNRIVLDGVDDFINLGTTPAINFTNGLTIEIEVNFAALSGSGWERFLDINDSSGTLFSFGRHSVFSNIQFTCREITGADAALQRRYQSTGNPLVIGQIATYSVTLPAGTPGAIRTGCKLYKNGVEIAGALATTNENPRLPLTQTRNIAYIGRSSSIGNAYLNGSVYMFKMYNRELSAAEISQNYLTTFGSI
jgi:hypothetical protein